MTIWWRIAAFMLASTAFAADPFYLGVWKIDSAVVAPWWTDPGMPDPGESKTLVGKTVTITPTTIVGPGILACKGPHYKVVTIPAEGLFQGAFEEMQRRDKSVDPGKLAAKEIDFHFVDPNTAEFGLNDYVYVLKKQ
jgi:hypothetical protein